MKASELSALVNLLTPCVLDADILPILSKICFTKDSVYAFNDVVATIYKWKHGLGEFAVDGKALSQVLSHMGDDEVQIKLAKNTLELSTKTVKTKLPASNSDEFVFQMPKVKYESKFTLGDDVAALVRLKEAMQTVATASVNPVYMAVILAEDGNDIWVYTTDGVTMTHAKISGLGKTKHSWVVPKLALEQLVAAQTLSGEEAVVTLGGGIMFVHCGDITIAAKLIEAESPDFQSPVSFDPHTEVAGWKTESFDRALSLAEAVESSFQSKCTISIRKRTGTVEASGNGEARSTVAFGKTSGEECNFSVIKPDLLRRAIKFESLSSKAIMKVGESAVLFADTDFLYAVSISGGS